MNRVVRNAILFLVLFLVIAGAMSLFTSPLAEPEVVPINDVMEHITNNEVEKIFVDGDKLTVTLKDGTERESTKEPIVSFAELAITYGLSPEQLNSVIIEVKDTTTLSWVGPLLSFGLPFLFIAFIFWFIFRQVQGQNNRAMSFGQSKAKDQQQVKRPNTTFHDVAGAKEAKEELREVVDFLKNPRKFTAVGARIPKGVLLIGAPGTGKTLMAKAVAGEASVPFFSISGSEFVEMFVGVGASRVRDLFNRAKKSAPCIIFIDEIDAVGRQRGAGLGGSHDEREQTLNQILVEMDGFDTDTNVIVIAATNRPDILDPALLRPGRFDRRVTVDMPDIDARREILNVHAKGKPLTNTDDLQEVAERTPGFSGADLSNLLNEAAILTARRNKQHVERAELLEAIEKVLLGPERKSRHYSKEEKKITAYHEAGHALVAHETPGADPVRKVSIISRGMAGGYTMKLPTSDKSLKQKKEFKAELAVMLGGWVAEQEVFGDITTGPSNDLQQATKLARKLVTQFGMSEKLGPRVFGNTEEMVFLGREIHEQRNYSEKIAQVIDAEVDALIHDAKMQATKVITGQRKMLDTIANTLIKHETLEKEAFEGIFEGKEPEVKKESTIKDTTTTSAPPKA
ncbi:MAG: ATP-dependent zinc metalloprotease FtsH [Patescibacteria group bacterium]